MKIAERERLDKRFKKMTNFGRWVRKHINKSAGNKIIDIVRDMWSESY